jgi:ribosomal protein S18 acetylase RimI-like enzyme
MKVHNQKVMKGGAEVKRSGGRYSLVGRSLCCQAPVVAELHVRTAGERDAPAVAALHADSWRRHYRGAYADSFLDGDVHADRVVVWSKRLREPAVGARTVVAETDGRVVGFSYTLLDADPTWGAFVDNLHVSGDYQRRGIGGRLMAASAEFVVTERPQSPLYLWVLKQNSAAQRFYEAIGGQCLEETDVAPVDGVAGRLNGTPVGLRYVWPDPAAIMSRTPPLQPRS